MKFELKDHNRNIPDEYLISDLKKVAKNINKEKLTTIEYKANGGKYSLDTYSRRFGSWFKCLELAGLKKTRSPINIPVEDLFENLIAVWTKLKRQPKYDEMFKPLSKFSSGTYERRFGTWRKALEIFVQYMNEENVEYEPSVNKAKKINGQRTSRNINIRLRFMVLRRDNFKCRICGKSPATDSAITLHVDHIHSWAKGGETVMENLQSLCSVCNVGKSDLSMTEIE